MEDEEWMHGCLSVCVSVCLSVRVSVSLVGLEHDSTLMTLLVDGKRESRARNYFKQVK